MIGQPHANVGEPMEGLLVEVTPADGSPTFEALLVGGQNPDEHLEDEEERLDEV